MPDNSGSGAPTTGEMLHSNAVAAAAAAAAAVSKQEPPAAVIPSTASEATSRKAAVMADKEWVDQYLAGSKAHAKELRELQAVINKEQNAQAEMAIAGQLYDGIQPSGHLAAVGAAQYLRAAGFGVEEVRQVIAGGSVSAQEHAAAVATKAQLMESLDFTAKYLAGDGAAKLTMTRLNSIISSSIRASAA